MAISRETVVWGFRLILGREPESEEGIVSHMALADEAALVETLLGSHEFRASSRLRVRLEAADPKANAVKMAWPTESRSRLKVAIFGNCQAAGVGRLIQAMTGDAIAQSYETTPGFLSRLHDGTFDLDSVVSEADLVLVQLVGEVTRQIEKRLPRHRAKVRQFPPLNYTGFHPDCVYVGRRPGGYVSGPMGEYQSSIVFWAWQHGLGPEQAVALFRDEVFDCLDFPQYHAAAEDNLIALGRHAGLPLAPLIDRWRAIGCFMHTINHPKLFALADVVGEVLRREGIKPLEGAHEWVDDGLARWPVWPVYPALANPPRLIGNYQFKLDRGHCPDQRPVLTMSLPEFVDASFARFREAPEGSLHCDRTATEAYARLEQFIAEPVSRLRRWAGRIGSSLSARRPDPPAVGANPYADLPDERFWRRAVEQVDPATLDPVLTSAWRISPTDRVATAGSCFAQNIARHLRQHGFNYMVVDAGRPPSPEAARERGFGVYSARYGNVYTSRQLVQLFDRAHGTLTPLDRSWKRADGRHVDPFRPQIEPLGHARPQDVEKTTAEHLADVRRLFAELDVFVFTLGLTEAWRRRDDGAVFPLAPGVAGGTFDASRYEFVNFGVEDVIGDLHAFRMRLRSVNPRARLILTVSPVPLIATYEDRHVLVSTIESKSVLRAAAGAFVASAADAQYFPSYEIITGPQARSSYFEPDLRSISEAGVQHVMRVFFRHFTADGNAAGTLELPERRNPAIDREQQQLGDIVCDEEALDRHRGP